MTTDTLDRIFISLRKSAGNILEQSATVLNSIMFYLSKQLSDHAPLIWTLTAGKPFCKGPFTARQEWVKHPVFLEHSSKMANAIDFQKLSLEEQKECIVIITEASAKAARDAIAFAGPEANELRMIRLNSIAQAVSTGDLILANALISYSTFASDLLKIEEGKPTLSDPATFEEAFADAKRAHIDRGRQDIVNDFSKKPRSLYFKKIQT